MIELYYIILAFGVLLFLFTASNWYKTKTRVSGTNTPIHNRVSDSWNNFKNNLNLWGYYFVAGDKKNLFKNIIISFIVFLASYYINLYYIRLDQYLFFIGFVLLFLLFIWKKGQRKNRKIFEEKFPEIIQVINSATSSGAGLLQALDRCGRDITGIVGDEFRTIHRRLAIGEDPTSVFADSYTRYPYKEFYFFITIIRTNLAKGGQMREVISRLGRIIADSKKMEQKKRAMTSEARMSAMIVACFPIGFFFFMRYATPENFDFLINDPSGRIVLYYVMGSELIGMFIIWWLMRKST